jgi:hypothetical protein
MSNRILEIGQQMENIFDILSLGCPVIADLTMIEIDNLIKGGQKNMLLWIYQ